MHRELKQALENISWSSLYEQWMPALASPNSRGECAARSPFPDTVDNTPSFSVNIESGLWYCFKTSRGGDYVDFRGLMEATQFDTDTGLGIYNYGEVERRLAIEFGVASAVDAVWIGRCRDDLNSDLATLHLIQRFKPWSAQVLYSLNIGYDYLSQRVVIPVYDVAGNLVNCRMYRPGGDPKFLWREPHLSGNFLFPHYTIREPLPLLVEGEPDAITLRSFGFTACSGTQGAGNFVPEGNWWYGKTVWLWGDDDEPGRRAILSAIDQLRRDARSVRLVQVPHWDNKPEGTDPTDYILHLIQQGFDYEGIRSCVVDLLNAAEEVQSSTVVYDQPAVDLAFVDALSAANLGQRVRFPARVAARSERRFILPTDYNIICPASGHQFCQRCPMLGVFHGNAHFTHDARASETLSLIQGSGEEQLKVLKVIHGIVRSCPDPRLVINSAVDIEPLMLASSNIEVEGEGQQDHRRREALLIRPFDLHVEENRDYTWEGFIYPAPRTQHGLFLIDRVEPTMRTYEEFEPTSDDLEALLVYQPATNQSVMDKLIEVAEDLAQGVTLIYGRPDLHLAYRTVWHSVLHFSLGEAPIERGWLEALVIGDTRCGKSVAFRRLAEYYAIGVLIDCKNQTPAGVLGSVVTSPASGERFVVAGILPQQDGRIVCFDEFHSAHWLGMGRLTLVDILSSTRSEGVVRITKAASAQFRARVRSIWLANPGAGKLMSELSSTGVELIPRVIGQPEDIARFDLALALSQHDVPVDVINAVRPAVDPRYTIHLGRTLLNWTYSRPPELVRFTVEAEDEVFRVTREMYTNFDATIPIVEPADQRVRVAKVAVSVAAQCFSTTDGNDILILPEHVEAAYQLFLLWYLKPTMGYDLYTRRVRAAREIDEPDRVLSMFDGLAHGHRLAQSLLEVDEFTERLFASFVPMEGMFTRTFLQNLSAYRCIKPVSRGRREAYELTPAFVQWLKRYLQT